MGERGYASILALSLLLGGVLMMGLAVDMARLVGAWRQASHLAHTAAETGAGWVRPAALYSGRLVVDEPQATEAALQVATGPGREVRVTSSFSEVCVVVAQEVRPGLIRLTGAGTQYVSVAACASPHRG